MITRRGIISHPEKREYGSWLLDSEIFVHVKMSLKYTQGQPGFSTVNQIPLNYYDRINHLMLYLNTLIKPEFEGYLKKKYITLKRYFLLQEL